MSGNSGKVGPVSTRQGTTIYPGFYGTVPAGFGRIQRLERGTQRTQRGNLRPTVAPFTAPGNNPQARAGLGNYTRLPNNILFTKTNGNQVLDVSKVFIRKIGGVSVSGNTSGFAYTATTTSITWYWDGTNGSKVPVITRADGSRFTVPTSGSPLTVSGLTLNTTYYFLPFWNINNLCNIGWVTGTTGTPQIAFVVADTTDAVNTPFYLMQQTLQTNEPLTSGFMSAATPVSGTGGGGGGGGGSSGSGCVMAGTDIIPIGDISYSIEVLRETEWVHLKIEDGRELYCTYDHPLYDAVDGRVRADMLVPGRLLITDQGEQRLMSTEFHQRICSKHKVHMPTGHLFWANGFLSHNVKPISPPSGA